MFLLVAYSNCNMVIQKKEMHHFDNKKKTTFFIFIVYLSDLKHTKTSVKLR